MMRLKILVACAALAALSLSTTIRSDVAWADCSSCHGLDAPAAADWWSQFWASLFGG